MQIIVLADEVTREEFKQKKISSEIKMIFAGSLSNIQEHSQADAFFLLNEDVDETAFRNIADKPIFINSTIVTLKELSAAENVIRFNGWPTFLNREVWEIATTRENIAVPVVEELGWKYITVADEPGLVAARIISMIINEAYFALGEDVSSKDEIDLAMKLGTNYPYGPFEWSKKIGLKNVYSLLDKLSKEDSRYSIAPAMHKEFNNQCL